MPTFGSIVQKGKFCASALADDKELKSVLLPTFGRPTIPHEKPMVAAISALASGRRGSAGRASIGWQPSSPNCAHKPRKPARLRTVRRELLARSCRDRSRKVQADAAIDKLLRNHRDDGITMCGEVTRFLPVNSCQFFIAARKRSAAPSATQSGTA